MSAISSQITGVSIMCSPIVQAQIKENIKGLCHCSLLGELTGEFPCKGPVTRKTKTFPFDDLIMDFPQSTPNRHNPLFPSEGEPKRVFYELEVLPLFLYVVQP